MVTNITLAAIFGWLLYANLMRMSFKLSSVLLLAQLTVLVVLFLIRRPANEVSKRSADWFFGMAGAFLPMLFHPHGGAGGEVNAGWFLQILGMAGAITALLSLNKSLGIVPADRGIKTKGLYSKVRHPLYASYMMMNAGFIINNFCARNLLVLVIATLVHLTRVFQEERFLSANLEYQAYSRMVRWRLVPYVW